MTDDQERVRRGVENTGLTEEELRVFDSLAALSESWSQLPDRSLRSNMQFASSYDSIAGMLAVRVVRRDHPEGWRTRGEVEDRQREEEDKAP